MNKILFSWSSGKDCAFALHELKQRRDAEIVSLLTTVTEGYERISMHGVRKELLLSQAEAAGLPLEIVYIPQNANNEIYEQRMGETLERFRAAGVSAVAFGDIFLEDLRKYREDNLKRAGLGAIFPVWKRDTTRLAREFIALGFKAVITCVDTQALDGAFSGREFDESFLNDLPPGVDPCGENGEFHSFVYDGPVFSEPISVEKGGTVLRDERFMYCEVLPAPDAHKKGG